MQALRATKHRRHGLDGGAHHIVVGVLLGQAPAAGLAMGAQHQALRVFGVEAFHDAAPKKAGSPHLRHFQVEVHADGPEKREPSGKLVHVHALGDGRLDIFLAIRQCKGHFQRLVGTGFLHVVTRNADRVELRHVLGRVLDDVTNDAHAWCRWVDVGVAHHELFQNVVLNGATELVLTHALLFGGNHITCQHGQDGAVHGHGDADCVERNLVKQNLHVFDRVNRDTGLTHVARHTRMVRVITPVRG